MEWLESSGFNQEPIDSNTRYSNHSLLHALALSFCVHQRTMEPMWQGAPALARAASKI